MAQSISLQRQLVKSSLLSSILAGLLALLMFIGVLVYQTMSMQDEIMDEMADMLLADDLTVSNGQAVNLTAKEFQILHKLMLKPEYVVTREQLEESLYAWGDEIESNAIEVFIYQLRKKLGSQCIKTIRGLGYRMNQDT